MNARWALSPPFSGLWQARLNPTPSTAPTSGGVGGGGGATAGAALRLLIPFNCRLVCRIQNCISNAFWDFFSARRFVFYLLKRFDFLQNTLAGLHKCLIHKHFAKVCFILSQTIVSDAKRPFYFYIWNYDNHATMSQSRRLAKLPGRSRRQAQAQATPEGPEAPSPSGVRTDERRLGRTACVISGPRTSVSDGGKQLQNNLLEILHDGIKGKYLCFFEKSWVNVFFVPSTRWRLRIFFVNPMFNFIGFLTPICILYQIETPIMLLQISEPLCFPLHKL